MQKPGVGNSIRAWQQPEKGPQDADQERAAPLVGLCLLDSRAVDSPGQATGPAKPLPPKEMGRQARNFCGW